MSDATNSSWSDRREQALRELCDLGMNLARKLAAKGDEAKTLDETERCAQAFDRVARSVRLTFALQARLERENRRGFMEDVQARRVQVREAVRAVIRPNFPTSERIDRERELDDRLAFEVLAADFLDRPVDDLIARIRRDLDLADSVPPLIPPPLGVADEVRGAGSHSDPVGEVDRALGARDRGGRSPLPSQRPSTPSVSFNDSSP